MTKPRNRKSRRGVTRLGLERLESRQLLSADLGLAHHAFAHRPSSPDTHVVAHPPVRLAAATRSHARFAAVRGDDRFENNDWWFQASDLGTLDHARSVDHLVMNDRADWYTFRIDDSVVGINELDARFDGRLGDLDLALYDARGRLIGRSDGTSNQEHIRWRGSGTYYAVVYGFRGATNPDYSLAITPGERLVDDRFESNDTWREAIDLGVVDRRRDWSHLVMADGHDWYRFQIAATGNRSSYVQIAFQHRLGDLDLELYDASGRLVGRSNGISDRETISLDSLNAGSYYVHVTGYRGATNRDYTLTVVPPSRPVPPPTDPSSAGHDTPSPAGQFQIELSLHGLTASQQAVVREAASRWEHIITGDLPDAVYRGRRVDDLLIDVQAGSIDGVGGVLGEAAPDRFRFGSQLPYHGIMRFDSADLARMEADGTLLGVIEHEMGHVLGIGTLWQQRGLLVGAGTTDPGFIGQQAVAAYDALCQCEATTVPVANRGGPGTRDAHWRESVFGNELMTGFIGPGRELPLSTVTIASLADLGYEVDLEASA